MNNLKFTGERVVPADMPENDITYLEHITRYSFALKKIEEIYGEGATVSVLDAACGSGYGTKMLKADGLDVSAEAVAYAKEKYGIKAMVCDFDKEFPNNYWGTIVSFETIEHLQDANFFLSEVAKRCKNFVFSIPLNNPSKFHKQVYSLDQAQKLIYRYFNKVEWFEQAGTVIKELGNSNPVFLVGVASNQEQPEADLVIVSHNSKKDLEKFLPSIKENTKKYNLNVIENGNEKESLENAILQDFKIVENRGYGAACNEGARMGKSEFIVFLNSDLEATPGWLEELLKPFNDKNVAVVGSRLFAVDGIEYPTPEKDMAIGCVFAVRRSIFEKLGGFDEDFFLFFEETDYCKRAIKAGYRVVRSEARMTHVSPHFLPQIEGNPFLKKCWDESKAKFEKKHNIVSTQKIFKASGKKCLVGIPCGSGVMPAYTVDGLFKMTRPCLTSLLIIERQTVDKARNYIIEMAIRLQVDYILFADDDGVLPADTLERLLEDDKDIVGAPMMTRNVRDNGQHALCVFEKYDFYIGDGKTINKYRSIEKFDNSQGYLHKVDAIGGACFLIKKEAFEALYSKHNGKPFEFLHEVHETKEHGVTVRDVSEDICFSERAKQEGFDIWIDTRVRPVHLGKPEFIRFEQPGENLPSMKEPMKGCITLSENLK
jgi:GT2 family glycosyltransferase